MKPGRGLSKVASLSISSLNDFAGKDIAVKTDAEINNVGAGVVFLCTSIIMSFRSKNPASGLEADDQQRLFQTIANRNLF